eukprot:COSAG06_NODE_29850_length_549_cov_1.171111_1_plen_55_part_10
MRASYCDLYGWRPAGLRRAQTYKRGAVGARVRFSFPRNAALLRPRQVHELIPEAK